MRGPAPPPRAAPDQSDLCMGYWKPTLTLSAGVADLRPLLEEEPTKDAAWRPDRWFRNELVVSQGTGTEPASTVIEGTLRAAGCKRYCVGGDGRRVALKWAQNRRDELSHARLDPLPQPAHPLGRKADFRAVRAYHSGRARPPPPPPLEWALPQYPLAGGGSAPCAP
jgi:hypothetical protein